MTNEQKARKETIASWLKKQKAIGESNGNQIDSLAVREAITRALLHVYANQTADEQSAKVTNHNNGKGYTGVDADFLSSLAESAKRYSVLSPRQSFYACKKLVKYSGQLIDLQKGRN